MNMLSIYKLREQVSYAKQASGITRTVTASNDRYRAPALDKGLDILELLSEQPNGLTRGEIVKAMVVPRAGGELDRAALDTHLQKHLSKHKRPRQIDVVHELPKNFLGKIQRRRLREGEGLANGNGQKH